MPAYLLIHPTSAASRQSIVDAEPLKVCDDCPPRTPPFNVPAGSVAGMESASFVSSVVLRFNTAAEAAAWTQSSVGMSAAAGALVSQVVPKVNGFHVAVHRWSGAPLPIGPSDPPPTVAIGPSDPPPARWLPSPPRVDPLGTEWKWFATEQEAVQWVDSAAGSAAVAGRLVSGFTAQ